MGGAGGKRSPHRQEEEASSLLQGTRPGLCWLAKPFPPSRLSEFRCDQRFRVKSQVLSGNKISFSGFSRWCLAPLFHAGWSGFVASARERMHTRKMGEHDRGILQPLCGRKNGKDMRECLCQRPTPEPPVPLNEVQSLTFAAEEGGEPCILPATPQG